MTAADDVPIEVVLADDAVALFPTAIPPGEDDATTEVDEYETAIDDDEVDDEPADGVGPTEVAETTEVVEALDAVGTPSETVGVRGAVTAETMAVTARTVAVTAEVVAAAVATAARAAAGESSGG